VIFFSWYEYRFHIAGTMKVPIMLQPIMAAALAVCQCLGFSLYTVGVKEVHALSLS
jgi:hypothetical protein